MAFPLQKPGGFVDVHSEVTPAIATNWDLWLSRAVDGTSGGTYVGDITLSGLLTLGGTNNLKLTARSIKRQQLMIGQTNDTAKWQQGAYNQWINYGTVGGTVYMPVDRLLHGATLTTAEISVDPAGGHGGDVTPPAFTLYRVDPYASATNLGTSTDPTGGVITSGYESWHTLSLSGLTEVVDLLNYRYFVALVGETGGFYVANAVYTNFAVTCNCSSYSEY